MVVIAIAFCVKVTGQEQEEEQEAGEVVTCLPRRTGETPTPPRVQPHHGPGSVTSVHLQGASPVRSFPSLLGSNTIVIHTIRSSTWLGVTKQ